MCPVDLHGCRRVRRGTNDRVEAIPKRLHNAAAVRSNCLALHSVVAGQCLCDGLGMLFPQPGAFRDVGEEERNDSTIDSSHWWFVSLHFCTAHAN